MWASADIFVFPTYYENETFGLVILEAMQHSIPVISTDEGGIPDVVEDGKTGFIVPKHDVQALADKIEYLIDNPDIAKSMGKAGRTRFKDKFTISVWEECLIGCIERSIKDEYCIVK